GISISSSSKAGERSDSPLACSYLRAGGVAEIVDGAGIAPYRIPPGFLSLGRQRAFCALLPAAWDVKRARPDPRTRGPPSDPARRVPQIVVRARSEHSGGDLRAGARPHLRSPDLRAHLCPGLGRWDS